MIVSAFLGALFGSLFSRAGKPMPKDYVYKLLLGHGVTTIRGMLGHPRHLELRAAIREGNRCSALGFAAAEKLLRASRVQGRRLFHRKNQFSTLKALLESSPLSLEIVDNPLRALGVTLLVGGQTRASRR